MIPHVGDRREHSLLILVHNRGIGDMHNRVPALFGHCCLAEDQVIRNERALHVCLVKHRHADVPGAEVKNRK
jgi:hypothetical protein